MKLNPAQEQRLAGVAGAANVAEGAKEALRDSVFSALDEGVPLTRVADASGVAHTTILRWLKAEGEGA